MDGSIGGPLANPGAEDRDRDRVWDRVRDRNRVPDRNEVRDRNSARDGEGVRNRDRVVSAVGEGTRARRASRGLPPILRLMPFVLGALLALPLDGWRPTRASSGRSGAELLAALPPDARRKIAADLGERLASASGEEFLSGILVTGRPLDLGALESEMDALGLTTRWQRHRHVIEQARARAEAGQADLRPYLEAALDRGAIEEWRAFWVTPAIAIRARPEVFAALAPLEGVRRLHPDRPVVLKDSGAGSRSPAPDGSPDLESGLLAIGADRAWARGLTGAGRLVAQFDSGADGSHEALAGRWRGARPEVPWEEAWFEPEGGTEFPNDPSPVWHGTGSLGIMVAAPPDGPPLGVAYEAEWIAAGVIRERPDVSTVIAAFEWAADPDGDPSTIDDVPDVVNHSWGTFEDCSTEYWDAIDLIEAAGIVNVIAAANTGPEPGSVLSPESRASSPYENFSVGGVNTDVDSYPVRNSSGRGPSPCDGVSIKPEVVGPASTVRSTGVGGVYSSFTGNSFAAPHVSGAVALLRQLDPSLSPREIKHALMITARDLGSPGEDNDSGWGLIDVAAAADFVERHFAPTPPPYSLTGPADPAPVAVLRWSPPRFRGAWREISGYRIYRAEPGEPFGKSPIAEVDPFPTEFRDREAVGRHRYVVTAIYPGGDESEPTDPVEIEALPPGISDHVVSLGSDHKPRIRVEPNPFSGGAEIRFVLPESGEARIELWSVAGRRIARLMEGYRESGSHVLTWDGRTEAGRRLPAGAYFLRIDTAGAGSRTIPILLLR